MSIDAMKQALDWFTCYQQKSMSANNAEALAEDVVAALRQGIAEAEQAQPVAWMHWLHGPVRVFLNVDEATMELDRLNREYPVDADARKMRPLVFGDTAPPPRQPLTDAEIALIAAACRGLASDFVVDVARAIEAAHGIGEKA